MLLVKRKNKRWNGVLVLTAAASGRSHVMQVTTANTPPRPMNRCGGGEAGEEQKVVFFELGQAGRERRNSMRRRGGGRACSLTLADAVGDDREGEFLLAQGAERAAIVAALVVDVLEVGAVGQGGSVGEVRRI